VEHIRTYFEEYLHCSLPYKIKCSCSLDSRAWIQFPGNAKTEEEKNAFPLKHLPNAEM